MSAKRAPKESQPDASPSAPVARPNSEVAVFNEHQGEVDELEEDYELEEDDTLVEKKKSAPVVTGKDDDEDLTLVRATSVEEILRAEQEGSDTAAVQDEPTVEDVEIDIDLDEMDDETLPEQRALPLNKLSVDFRAALTPKVRPGAVSMDELETTVPAGIDFRKALADSDSDISTESETEPSTDEESEPQR